MYEPRIYRHWTKDRDLVSFNVTVRETDLHIRAKRNLRRKALEAVQRYRSSLEQYIERQPGFLKALDPFPVGEDAPLIAREMASAADKVGVGPMAAVAGAIAENVGRDLLPFSTASLIFKAIIG